MILCVLFLGTKLFSVVSVVFICVDMVGPGFGSIMMNEARSRIAASLNDPFPFQLFSA